MGDTILMDEMVDHIPLAIWTPKVMPHEVIGVSLADDVMDIQLWKSTLLRGINDSMYQSIAPRMFVQGDVNLDDVLTVRPGGVIRGEPGSSLTPIAVPFVGQQAFPLLEYADQKEEVRTGISRLFQGIDPQSINKTATGVNALMNQANARVELIARNAAEFGFKPLFKGIMHLLAKYQTQALMVRLTNQFVPVDPETCSKEYKSEDRALFEGDFPFQDLIMAIFLKTKQRRHGGRTLIFIDEIQNSPKAVALLRYFKEEADDLYVIAAGSLLETVLGQNLPYPVGRIEYMRLHPVSFREFLVAKGDLASVQLLEHEEIPGSMHTLLIATFKEFLTIGGMPQVVEEYLRHGDLTRLGPIYESLIQSYQEDIEKYASSPAQVHYLRYILSVGFQLAGTRITIQNFGGSGYKYREMREAFSTIEKTLLFQLVYPTSEVVMPAIPKENRKPRLQALDTGLIIYSVNVMKDILTEPDLSEVYKGRIAEHITGQELFSLSFSVLNKLQFSEREKRQSKAEIDYLFNFQGMLIPIEVKAGHAGKLKSLHQFVDLSPLKLGVRVWQGPFSIESIEIPNGVSYKLINLPFYLIHRLEHILSKHI